MEQEKAYTTSKDMAQCIEDCLDCQRSCLTTMFYSLDAGGKYAETEHIRMMLDCVALCRTSADLMVRESELHAQVCAVCAVACKRCAQACERFGNDSHMQAAVLMCRRCEKSCRKMARQEAP